MSWDYSGNEKWTWDQIPLGAMTLEGGTATGHNTGDWRVQRPIWHPDTCKQCLICFINCPDSSIKVEDQKMCGIDYDHCKGCGVCVQVCPFNALSLMSEKDARELNDVKEAN